ncbi:MAG: type III-B CRISPR module-associated protein Cmr5 [Thermoflexus sp.]|uniref:type III-B CRISPR module-associated protein Cmr5 n=1 Tax=Thermoflexus sp. TaxID=1969742 RepID=UPI0025E63A0C|nr:type III-B CRISPR module-associated protein Cmr5 [Thermoflexus sp.]MCS6964099.1 type III-B CRISPR module-associated protein Cmr5 [Thermoflexus sp.]MDW8186234.1 type III-B CRISPR module-associated protein Cmr5 [Anaerolineae bacterium]
MTPQPSRQRSLELERARVAWQCIQEVVEENKKLEEKNRYWGEYRSLAMSAPADVQANGLGQTAAFWRAKGYERDKDSKEPKPKSNSAHAKLLQHLARWLSEESVRILPKGKDPVAWISTEAQPEAYRRATAEAIAFLIWLRRFAEAELAKEEE